MNGFKMSGIYFSIFLISQSVMPSSQWRHDWEKALQAGKSENRPVLMDFYTDWCPPCKKLSSVTFRDEKVLGYFKRENFMLIKVNPEKDRAAEKRFKVFSYPTLLLFNKNGKEIARILGYRSPEEFIKTLSLLRKGIGTLEYLLRKYRKDSENLELISKIVNKYIARADYPEALTLLDKIMKSDKGNKQGKASEALFRKGYIYYKWKKYKRSIDILVSVRNIYPGSKEAEDGSAAAIEYSLKLKNHKLTSSLIKSFLKHFPSSRYRSEYLKLYKKINKK